MKTILLPPSKSVLHRELIAAFLKESHMTQAERDRLRKLLDEMEV